jgi:hypothetical protein
VGQAYYCGGVKLVDRIPDLTLLIAISLKTIQVLISNKKHSALICSHSKGPFIITTMNDNIYSSIAVTICKTK